MFAATIALAKEARLTAVAVGIETNRQLAAGARARLLGRAGLPAAGPGLARPRSPQGRGGDGNVRAMASTACDWAAAAAATERRGSSRRAEAGSRRGGCRAGRGRDAGRSRHRLDRRPPASGDRPRGPGRAALRGDLAGDRTGRAELGLDSRDARRARRARHRDRRRRPGRPAELADQGRRRRTHAREDRRGRGRAASS